MIGAILQLGVKVDGMQIPYGLENIETKSQILIPGEVRVAFVPLVADIQMLVKEV